MKPIYRVSIDIYMMSKKQWQIWLCMDQLRQSNNSLAFVVTNFVCSSCRLIDQSPPVSRWLTSCEFDESSFQMHCFTGGLYQPIASLSLLHAVVFVNTRCAYVCAFDGRVLAVECYAVLCLLCAYVCLFVIIYDRLKKRG